MTSLRHVMLSAVIVVLVLLGIGLASPRSGDAPTSADARLTTDAGTSAPEPSAPPTESSVPSVPTASAAPPTSASPPSPTRTTPRTTAPRTSAPRTATAVARDGGVAAQVLALVNAERADAGCDPVSLDARLNEAAARHSRDMASGDFLEHDSSDGSSFSDRIRAAGHPSPRSENIAAGQESASEVVQTWMDSSGHRANILDCSARTMGLARATGGSFGVYWTQDFGS